MISGVHNDSPEADAPKVNGSIRLGRQIIDYS